MVIDVSVVRPCMRQLNSDQSWIKELEKSVASVAVGSGLRSQVHRKKSRQKNITCCRIGYKIGCTGVSATTSMQLYNANTQIQNSFSFCCLDYSLCY